MGRHWIDAWVDYGTLQGQCVDADRVKKHRYRCGLREFADHRCAHIYQPRLVVPFRLLSLVLGTRRPGLVARRQEPACCNDRQGGPDYDGIEPAHCRHGGEDESMATVVVSSLVATTNKAERVVVF